MNTVDGYMIATVAIFSFALVTMVFIGYQVHKLNKWFEQLNNSTDSKTD